MSGNLRSQRSTLPSQELLDDLCSRFVLNAPEEELQSFERILFLVEQAHWFYEDNTMEQNATLKSLTLREFTSLMFQSCAALRPYISQIDDIYKDFTTYKIRVPVTGAIILDESYERCLLVKGWKPGASWSFPRGKKNKDEEDHKCACREVWEETGFDVADKIHVDQYLEVVIGQQRMRLYIIAGVNEDTQFAPQTKKEISEIAWHRVDELPVASNETSSHSRGSNETAASHNRGATGMKYFMVWPFVGPLKNWISEHSPSASAKDPSNRGTTVWKVKHTTASSSSNGVGILNPPTLQSSSSSSDILQVVNPDDRPGKSFRNFRFDRAKIMAAWDGI
ncbi:hypothetical protein R1sor_021650 [Riccia sorocarpa]|uniref:Nudix hydrolase domain-containing protein n=1 Tax=Riccia sorocarpa TaxID=122646 RepID=A0ABD3GNE6_9MARC